MQNGGLGRLLGRLFTGETIISAGYDRNNLRGANDGLCFSAAQRPHPANLMPPESAPPRHLARIVR